VTSSRKLISTKKLAQTSLKSNCGTIGFRLLEA
jgi:hypothetical protein